MPRVVFFILAIVLFADISVGDSSGVRVIGGSITPAPTGGNWSAIYGPCTSGVDCFRDRVLGTGVNGTSDPLYDPLVYAAEDFDNDRFYATSPASGGNWVAGGSDRGSTSLWNQRYGFGATGTWTNGEPDSFTHGNGSACAFSVCQGLRVWDDADRWDGNTNTPGPFVHIMTSASSFTNERSGSTVPTIEGSGGASFFGNAMMGMRVPLGTASSDANNGSILGVIDSGTTRSQFGHTRASGYESNVLTSGVLSDAWKHDETYGRNRSDSPDGLSGFRVNASDTLGTWGFAATQAQQFPFHAFIFAWGSWDCQDAITGMTATAGTAFCNGTSLIVTALPTGPNAYSFSTDHNTDEIHCFQAYWDFRDIASVQAKYAIDGKVVIDIDGMNFTGSAFDGSGGTNGVNDTVWNMYSNRASGVVGNPPLNETTRRYSDNYTLRNGTPYPCSKTGFPSSYDAAFPP